jgi:predicted TIM-barrel fold metal-dependent hydrolase
MNIDELIAIDVHAHAEISIRDPQEPTAFQQAAQQYFKTESLRPSIPEIAEYYRERKIGCVIFSVDGQRVRGDKPVSNEEVAELAAEHADVMIPFASVDPGRGQDAIREARRLIEHYGVKGFKFHPQYQEFFPNDRSAYPLYEVIAAAGLPALFHTGHSGMGTGMRGGERGLVESPLLNSLSGKPSGFRRTKRA